MTTPPALSIQHLYPVTPHTRARLKCHLEASGAGWASGGCCSCRQTSHCQRASPWTNAGQCGTGIGLSSGGSVDSGYLCPERFPGKRGKGQCHLTCLLSSVQPEAPYHPQFSFAPQANLSQHQGAPSWSGPCCWLPELWDCRRQEQSCSLIGCAWSQAFLTIKSGQQG